MPTRYVRIGYTNITALIRPGIGSEKLLADQFFTELTSTEKFIKLRKPASELHLCFVNFITKIVLAVFFTRPLVVK